MRSALFLFVAAWSIAGLIRSFAGEHPGEGEILIAVAVSMSGLVIAEAITKGAK